MNKQNDNNKIVYSLWDCNSNFHGSSAHLPLKETNKSRPEGTESCVCAAGKYCVTMDLRQSGVPVSRSQFGLV